MVECATRKFQRVTTYGGLSQVIHRRQRGCNWSYYPAQSPTTNTRAGTRQESERELPAQPARPRTWPLFFALHHAAQLPACCRPPGRNPPPGGHFVYLMRASIDEIGRSLEPECFQRTAHILGGNVRHILRTQVEKCRANLRVIPIHCTFRKPAVLAIRYLKLRIRLTRSEERR